MISYEKLKIHSKIRNIREIKNMTREFVAAELDVTPRTISDIESGATKITLERLVHLCNIFNCSLHEILEFNASNFFTITVNQQKGNNGNNINNQQINNDTKYLELIVKTFEEQISLLKEELKRLRKD